MVWGLAALVPTALGIHLAVATQLPLRSQAFHHAAESEFFEFTTPIKRVAVIGAGPSGLIHASTLIEEGFEVRLFERAPNPGGQWLYTDKTPVHTSFPNRPNEISAYIPDIPKTLPMTKIYSDGDGGLPNDWRMREHWNPSSVWARLWSTVPPYAMSFPGITYAPDTPWRMQNRIIQRYVRQYASHVGLNANDEESVNITSYSTRVERVQKLPGETKWTLTLRKVVEVPGDGEAKKLRVDWWSEEFDAVVVGTHSEADSAWVPPIPGLAEWAHAYPEEIYHGREYRRPEPLQGKNVLIVGGSVSGSGIGADLAGHAGSIVASVRQHPNNPLFDKIFMDWFAENTTFIPEIREFAPIPRSRSSRKVGVRDAQITLINGTVVSGFDHIILATGYRYSFPFLAGLHNSSIVGLEDPETRVAPIITDGTHHRSLHWTGHYIPDPTLGLATYEPWELGPYQAKGFARSWKRMARLPSTAEMWKAYPGPGHELLCRPGATEFCYRLFLTWLNNANLEFGGQMLESSSLFRYAQGEAYFLAYYQGRQSFRYINSIEKRMNTPRAEWPVWNGSETRWKPGSMLAHALDEDTASQAESGPWIPHWAELSDRW
ncbi:FAD/NAD(P)-binding domain-containing protein [Clavulina sp. PMI_390]|nr:FAD/NAD(P)-binding domain-containing protein [Clavulina sp. PMI_390]